MFWVKSVTGIRVQCRVLGLRCRVEGVWYGYQWLVLIARLVEKVVVREAAVCTIAKVDRLARQLENSPRMRPAEMFKRSRKCVFYRPLEGMHMG